MSLFFVLSALNELSIISRSSDVLPNFIIFLDMLSGFKFDLLFLGESILIVPVSNNVFSLNSQSANP
ncbi:50S ribosomal protein L31 [Psychrobacter sp. 1501(2011)]|nr:50S ribosomal protein L31 [Psychrobacter sp. 1501(2011)]